MRLAARRIRDARIRPAPQRRKRQRPVAAQRVCKRFPESIAFWRGCQELVAAGRQNSPQRAQRPQSRSHRFEFFLLCALGVSAVQDHGPKTERHPGGCSRPTGTKRRGRREGRKHFSFALPAVQERYGDPQGGGAVELRITSAVGNVTDCGGRSGSFICVSRMLAAVSPML